MTADGRIESPSEAGEPRRSTEKTESGGIGRRVLGGIAWTLSGTAAQAVLQVVTTMVLARLLTPEVFGAVAAALVVIKVTQFFTNLGLSGAIIQRPDLEEQHIRTAFASLLWFGLLMLVVIQLAAPWIAAFYRIDEVESIIRLLAFALLFSNIMEVPNGLMRRDLQFRQVAAFAVVSFAVGYGLIGIGLAYLGLGVFALAAAHVGQTFVNMVLMVRYRPHPRSLLIRWVPFKQLIRFGSGMMAWRTASNMALEADNLIVGRYLGATELGLYSRAYWLAATPAVLFGRGIAGVLFSSLARLQEDRPRMAEAYRRGVAVTNLISVPASIAIAIFAPELVAIVLGPQWTGAVPPLQILAVGLLFRLSVRVSDSLTGAVGAVYRTATIQTLYALSVLLGAYIGQHWGVNGVAFGILGALVLNFLLMTGLALHLTSLPVLTLLRTFIPGIRTTAVLGPLLFVLEAVLDERHVPALLILLIAAAVTLLFALLMLRLAPRFFFGADGLWVMHLALSRAPRRLVRFINPLIAPAARPKDTRKPKGESDQS